MTQGLGILEFPKIRHCGNSVIASEAKQSLEILNLSLEILNLSLEILEFCSLLG